jgi:hypothetical protein
MNEHNGFVRFFADKLALDEAARPGHARISSTPVREWVLIP